MTSLELEALRRQVEEDYKLDMAAIDRLQRRFNEAVANGSKVVPTSLEKQPAAEAKRQQPVVEARKQPAVETRDARGQQPDQLTESLRSMFSNYK